MERRVKRDGEFFSVPFVPQSGILVHADPQFFLGKGENMLKILQTGQSLLDIVETPNLWELGVRAANPCKLCNEKNHESMHMKNWE